MTKKICFSTLLIYFVVMCLFVVLRICSYYGVFSFLGDYSSLVFSLITQILLIGLLPLFAFKKANKLSSDKMKSCLRLRKTSGKVILISFLLGVVVFFVNMYVSTFFNSIIQAFGYTPSSSSSTGMMSWGMFFLELFTTAILPAVFEELLHRGMLLSGTTVLGVKKSVIICGVFFGLLHLNIEQVFYASIIGLFLAFYCNGCNSIYPCMIIHFMNNAISVTLSFLSSRGVNFVSGLSNFVLANHVLGILLILLFLILLIYIGYGLVRAAFKESFRFNFTEKQKEISARAIRENFFDDLQRIRSNGEENQKNYSIEENVIKIDLGQFLDFVSKNLLNREVQPQKKIVDEKKTQNIDLKIKILLWGIAILGVVVNVMTFVWGLLR